MALKEEDVSNFDSIVPNCNKELSKNISEYSNPATKDRETTILTKVRNNDTMGKMSNFDDISKKPTQPIFLSRKLLFKVFRRGRPRKCDRIKKNLKRGKYRPGNVVWKIINATGRNVHKFINYNYKGLNLNEPTFSEQHKKSHQFIRKIANKNLYDIYKDTLPKRVKGDSKINCLEKEKRKEIRRDLYQGNNNNKKEIDRLLAKNDKIDHIIFKDLKLKDFIKSYLYNKNVVRFGIRLIGFETYAQDFNFEYDQEQKERYKNHVLNIVDKEEEDE